MISASSESKNQVEILETGSYVGRVYQIIHIGTTETAFGSKDKARITFELPEEMVVFSEEKGPQPRAISKEFALSTHEKSILGSLLSPWLGKEFVAGQPFDVESLLGKCGMVTITHETTRDGKLYPSIASVTPLPKSLVCPDPINPPVILNYNDKWDEKVFEALPDFIKNKMMETEEYKTKMGILEDTIRPEDVPF